MAADAKLGEDIFLLIGAIVYFFGGANYTMHVYNKWHVRSICANDLLHKKDIRWRKQISPDHS